MITPPRGRWFRAIASTRLAAMLIAALALLNLIGFVLPQEELIGVKAMADFRATAPWAASVLAAVGLDKIYSGWPLALIALLLAFNTTACTWVRLHRFRTGAPPRSAPARTRLESAGDPWDVLDAAESIIRSRGWVVLRATGSVFAMRGRSGFWGSMLLHLGILTVLVGGAAGVAAKFDGQIVLTEGQSVVDSPAAYVVVNTEPTLGEAYTGAQLTLQRMHFAYTRGQLVWAGAEMEGVDLDGQVIRREARVNYPFELEGKSYLLLRSGYAADLTVTGPAGPTRSVVNLADKDSTGGHDSLQLTSASIWGPVLELTATPVPLRAGESLPIEEFDLQNPRLEVSVASSDASGVPTVLSIGESVGVGNGWAVTFNGLRLWSLFLVRKDPMRWVVYVGFWMGIVGIMWRFFVPERRVSASVASDSGLVIGYGVRPWRGTMWGNDRDLVEELEALGGHPEENDL